MTLLSHNLSLFDQIMFAISKSNEIDWSDAIIQPGQPVVLTTPKGNLPVSNHNVRPEQIADLIDLVWQLSNGQERTELEWQARLKKGAIKEAIDFETPSEGDKPGSTARLRFTIVRASAGASTSVVVRYIPQDLPTLDQLGFQRSVQALTVGSGLVLVTGPTRNGKSTVVASFVEEIRSAGSVGHIVKIEDPMEFIHHSTPKCIVTAREIGTDVATYREAAEDALRMAPDVIVIGEIRDADTAIAALNLGESGHLVFATMQASTVEGALTKIETLAASKAGAKETIQASVRGVIRTALVPNKTCDRFLLAHEFIINQGGIGASILKGDLSNVRTQLRERALPNFGQALNTHLMTMLSKGYISQEAAHAASNDRAAHGTPWAQQPVRTTAAS
jgi:twitching motility protein PilT